MKCKRNICLAVLMVSISVTVYAQELQFNGYFNSGIGIVSNSSEGLDYSDVFLKAFGVDSEQNGYRLRLNFSYTNEAMNAGVALRVQSQGQLDPWGYFSLPYVYGWMRFFNDIVYLAGGIVDDSTWQTTDWWINDDVGEGLGVLLKLTPITGFNVGVGAYLISQQAAGSNNVLSFGGFLPNFSNITPKIGDAKYTFGVSYTMPDVFWLGAAFRMKNKASWNYTREEIEKYGYIYDGRQESAQLIGEFRFLLIQNLTAIVSVSLDKLEEFDVIGDTVLSQTFAYKFDKFSLGFNAAEFMYNRMNLHKRKVLYNPGLLFNLWGSYTFNNIVPRLDAVYFMGGKSRVGGNETYMWHRRGFINREIFAIGSDNSRFPSVFSIRPSVKFNLPGGTFVETGNMFNYDFGNYDAAYGDSADLKKRERISNVFYIDLKWSF